MPIYEYECSKCGCFEYSQSIKDAPLERCPKCRRRVHKLVSAPAFHLKGGGWYADGYAKKGASNGSGSGESSSSETTTSNDSSNKTSPPDKKAAKPAKEGKPAGSKGDAPASTS